MLIPLQEVVKKYNLNLNGVIQVGAHWSEEHEVYIQLGIINIVYIEPCKDAFEKLIIKHRYPSERNPHVTVILFNVACSDEEGEMEMYVSHFNQGQSNSLLKPQLHLQQHPEVVFTDTEKVKVIPLDKLPFNREDYNLLVMDCQGAEGNILKGATETLKHIDCIYTEINTAETYDGNMLLGEMDDFLGFYDFFRVETKMASENLTWGDAVYLKSHLI